MSEHLVFKRNPIFIAIAYETPMAAWRADERPYWIL